MIRNLAYAGFVSPAAEEWRSFGPEVLGAELAPERGDGTVRLRVDDAAWRIAIEPGDRDDVAYLGWDVGDAASLDEACGRVERAGFIVHRDDSGVRTERPVAALAWFVDPFGFRHELTHGLEQGELFRAGRPMSGFVTGEQGVGHVVLFVPDIDDAERFVAEVLGLRLSDTIIVGRGAMRFFHCPGSASRHHTVALACVPGMVGLHHLMLEVTNIDDVGTALDRAIERQVPITASLGRHPNDRMTSFYMRNPSGFEIEYGTGGVVVDDASWSDGATYDQTSIWGHRTPEAGRGTPSILRPYQPQGAPA